MTVQKIVVADKNPLVLRGLESMFNEPDAFECLASVRTGPEFMDVVYAKHFDIGIIGWEMLGLDGRSILNALSRLEIRPKIVIYTGVPSKRVIREAMLNGAAGFCSKGESAEQLMMTVKGVAAGQMVFPQFDFKLLQDDPWDSLTLRELDLLEYLRTGQTNPQIAEYLGISVNTVKFHLKNLFQKIDVKNRAQAVAVLMARKSHS